MGKDYKKIIKDKRLEAGKLMTEDQMATCHGIIHTASVACGAAGAIPIPVADAVPISAAQIAMVIGLGAVFDQKIEDSAAKSAIAAAASTFAGRNLIKLIPVVGWGVSAAVAAGVTEAIGWTIAIDMAKTFRKEWEKQKNAQEAAEAFAQAEYYKKVNRYQDDNDEADDFGED